jgi:hypothetical protein
MVSAWRRLLTRGTTGLLVLRDFATTEFSYKMRPSDKKFISASAILIMLSREMASSHISRYS